MRVVSGMERKNFSGEFKAKVVIEGMRSIKTVNVVVRNLGCIPHTLVRNFTLGHVFLTGSKPPRSGRPLPSR
jgi:transposase-like protein